MSFDKEYSSNKDLDSYKCDKIPILLLHYEEAAESKSKYNKKNLGKSKLEDIF